MRRFANFLGKNVSKTFTMTAETNGIPTVCSNGKFEILIDQPKVMGGDNSGLSPMEVNLSSLLACENVTARFIASKNGIDLKRMKLKVSGDYDPKCFLTGEGRGYWQKVDVEYLVETDATEEQLEEIKELTHKRCPVATFFYSTDIEMSSTWKIVDSSEFELDIRKESLYKKMMNKMMRFMIRDKKECEV